MKQSLTNVMSTRDTALPVTEMEKDEAGYGTRSKDHLCISWPHYLVMLSGSIDLWESC